VAPAIRLSFRCVNMSPRKTSKSKARPGSLLSPEAMGGITASKGFGFQTRYAVCQLPVWLLDSAFHQLFHEGTGDIDIRFQEAERSSRIHVQVKDHNVAPAEFCEVVAQFQERDAEFAGIYTCFTLVCPSLSENLQSIESGLARLRNAKPFYDDVAAAMTPTKVELDERMRSAGLAQDQIDFVHSKVKFDIVHGDLHHDDRASDVFIAQLLKHPEYKQMIRDAVQPAFAELLRSVDAKRGAVFGRADIEDVLRRSIVSVGSPERAITLWVQNWTSETFDIPADYVLDWAQEFDRNTRRVPTEDVWNNRLLPELKALRDKIATERKERLIRFRGRCALSTSIALGATLPVVGGWAFEVPQPPASEPWRSDETPASPYELHVDVIDGGGADIVLGLNIRGDGREDVRRYIDSTGVPPKLFAFMAPGLPGSQSISGSAEACAFARAVREQLGALLKKNGVRNTRLFFYGPQALAIFLGQQLTSVGKVQLFEYQDPGYVPSVLLST
jgi:hypothetical protein